MDEEEEEEAEAMDMDEIEEEDVSLQQMRLRLSEAVRQRISGCYRGLLQTCGTATISREAPGSAAGTGVQE